MKGAERHQGREVGQGRDEVTAGRRQAVQPCVAPNGAASRCRDGARRAGRIAGRRSSRRCDRCCSAGRRWAWRWSSSPSSPIPWLVPVTTGLAEARDALVEALGAGVFLLILLLGVLGWLIIRRTLFSSFYLFWRRWLVSLLRRRIRAGLPGALPARVEARRHGAVRRDGRRRLGTCAGRRPAGVLAWWRWRWRRRSSSGRGGSLRLAATEPAAGASSSGDGGCRSGRTAWRDARATRSSRRKWSRSRRSPSRWRR